MTAPQVHAVSPFPAAGERPADLPDLVGRHAPPPPHVVARHPRPPARRVGVTRGGRWRRVCALAEELREHGIAAGDAIAVWLPNWSDALVWQCAAY